jgi:hypothetical protein
MTTMFRKLTIALGAAAVVGAAALSPTAASAGWHGHHWHHGWHGGYGIGFYGPAYAAASDCYVVRRVVYTPYGKRFRRVTVCD